MNKEYNLQEIKEIFEEFYKSMSGEMFIDYISKQYFELQNRIKALEERKLSKSDIEKVIYMAVEKAEKQGVKF